MNNLIKGKKYPVGTVRDWKNGTYIKTEDGWKEHEPKQTSDQEEKVPEPIQEIFEKMYSIDNDLVIGQSKPNIFKIHDSTDGEILAELEMKDNNIVGEIYNKRIKKIVQAHNMRATKVDKKKVIREIESTEKKDPIVVSDKDKEKQKVPTYSKSSIEKMRILLGHYFDRPNNVDNPYWITSESHIAGGFINERKISNEIRDLMKEEIGRAPILSEDDFEALQVLHENGIYILAPTNNFYKSLSVTDDKHHSFNNRSNFRKIVSLRLNMLFGVKCKGNWHPKMLEVVKNFEIVSKELPQGHITKNKFIKSFQNHKMETRDTYAYYNKGKRVISLSDSAVNDGQLSADVSKLDEFKHVVRHEMGHAVSKKLQNHNMLGWVEIAKAAGWNEKRAMEFSTGDIPNIPKNNPDVSSISSYAKKSAEENFAELYSTYLLNKDSIDDLIDDKNNDSHIVASTRRSRRKTITKNGSLFKQFKLLRKYVFEDKKMIKALKQEGLNIKKAKALPVGTVRNWKGGSYIKTGDGWKPHIIQGGKAKKEKTDTKINKHNSHLAKIADRAVKAMDDYKNFDEIIHGACGQKGIVTVDEKKYFIKREDSDAKEVFGDLQLTNKENLYFQCISNAFPELMDSFNIKYQIDENTYVSDYIDIIKYDNYVDGKFLNKQTYMEEFSSKKENQPLLLKLGIMNALLYNTDRHINNFDLDKNGNIKLFDEGLSFFQPPQDVRINVKLPAYLDHLPHDAMVNVDEIKAFLTRDRRNKIIEQIKNSDISDKKNQIRRFKNRWDSIQLYLSNSKDTIDPVELITDVFTDIRDPGSVVIGDRRAEARETELI